MANRRELKKKIKQETNLLIEDAFMESIEGDAKEKKKMDILIDELIDDRHELISKVSNYPKNSKKAEVRNHFNLLQEELNEKTAAYSKKIGRVG